MKAKIINEIIRVEGGYVNDPKDSGGQLSNPRIEIKEYF